MVPLLLPALLQTEVVPTLGHALHVAVPRLFLVALGLLCRRTALRRSALHPAALEALNRHANFFAITHGATAANHRCSGGPARSGCHRKSSRTRTLDLCPSLFYVHGLGRRAWVHKEKLAVAVDHHSSTYIPPHFLAAVSPRKLATQKMGKFQVWPYRRRTYMLRGDGRSPRVEQALRQPSFGNRSTTSTNDGMYSWCVRVWFSLCHYPP